MYNMKAILSLFYLYEMFIKVPVYHLGL